MNTISEFLFQHAQYAHWIVLGSLLIAGFYIPISEDFLIIMSALLASTIVPENTYKLLFCIYLGCLGSDWTVYWIGRLFGHKLRASPSFSKKLPEARIKKIENFYKDYGIYTLLIGRFIPFGVRNVLFTVAGMSKMPLKKFIFADLSACLLSNTTLFFLAYFLRKNFSSLMADLKVFNILLFTAFIVTIITLFWYHRKKNKSRE